MFGRAFACTAVAVVATVGIGGTAHETRAQQGASASAQRLFRPSGALPRSFRLPAPHRAAIRGRTARLNPAALRMAESSEPVLLNLFADTELVVRPQYVRHKSGSRVAWSGSIDGGGTATFARIGDGISGVISAPGRLFKVRASGVDDIHLIYELDSTRFPDEAEPLRVGPSETRASTDAGAIAAKKDKGKRFDVLVLYTRNAREEVGGTDEMERQIMVAEADTNAALARVRAPLTVDVVDTIEVAYDGAAALLDDLNRLKKKNDDIIDDIHTMRDLYGADQVHLIVKHNASSCGIAFVMSGGVDKSMHLDAFSVSGVNCTADNRTFAHEVAHNWGFDHAREDLNLGGGVFGYSYGYKDPDGDFRTIMAYRGSCPGNCPREVVFSDPRTTIGGDPAGIPRNRPNAADNAATIKKKRLRKTIANFRLSRNSDFFNEKFGKRSKGKPLYAIEGEWEVKGGKLVFTSSADRDRWPSVAFKGEYPNVNFVARIRRGNPTGCVNHANTVFVKGKPYPKFDANGFWNTVYQFSYSNNREFSVWSVIDFQLRNVTGWTFSSAIKEGTALNGRDGAWQELEVTIEGTNITFFINGTKVWQGSDPRLSSVDPDANFVGVAFARCPSGPDTFEVDFASALEPTR